MTSTSSKGSGKHLPACSGSSTSEAVRPRLLGWRAACRRLGTDKQRPSKHGGTANPGMEVVRRRRCQGSSTKDRPEGTGKWETAHCNLLPKSRICCVQPGLHCFLSKQRIAASPRAIPVWFDISLGMQAPPVTAEVRTTGSGKRPHATCP